MDEVKCARCGRQPTSEAEFDVEWFLVWEDDREEGIDSPYCPECMKALRHEGRVAVPDPEVGMRWAPAPRGEG